MIRGCFFFTLLSTLAQITDMHSSVLDGLRSTYDGDWLPWAMSSAVIGQEAVSIRVQRETRVWIRRLGGGERTRKGRKQCARSISATQRAGMRLNLSEAMGPALRFYTFLPALGRQSWPSFTVHWLYFQPAAEPKQRGVKEAWLWISVQAPRLERDMLAERELHNYIIYKSTRGGAKRLKHLGLSPNLGGSGRFSPHLQHMCTIFQAILY